MELKITAKELKEKEEIVWSDEDNVLTLFWLEHLERFFVKFNAVFLASSKTITSPLKKFNQMAKKHGLTN